MQRSVGHRLSQLAVLPASHTRTIHPPIPLSCRIPSPEPTNLHRAHRHCCYRHTSPSLQSQHRRTRCAHPTEPATRSSRARLHGPLHPSSAFSRHEPRLAALSHHGPPTPIAPGRAITARPPSRVFQPSIPTALSHVHRTTADTDTLLGSLLTRSRSVSPGIAWKERQSGTWPTRMAARSRYVQESVTQKRVMRRREALEATTPSGPCRCAAPANGISQRPAATARDAG